LTYYGQDSFQSGYVAAKLLLNSLPDNAQVVVIRTKRKGAESNQTIARKNGFMHFISENGLSNIELLNIEMTDDDENTNFELLREVFDLNSFATRNLNSRYNFRNVSPIRRIS